MNFYTQRFNLYLLVLLAGLMAFTGCKTGKSGKHLATFRMHMENRAQVPGTGKTVSVLRSMPVLVTINDDPFLTERNVVAARVLNTIAGCAIEVKFDETGTWILEQYTSANTGRHFAIFSQWGESAEDARWLASPLISHRISNGVFSFTPDASPEEVKKIVDGLNEVAKQIAKGK